ncbi:uncharacterized protein RHOBADRAFT_43705 [Rhodotorula graminis WP1]|uniref:Uncharacterized protein n=1 Tax=Rhodotorula graminis (strain WP1) TaxID=578459 RepID=A0A194S721_RHOGW|nr:uncharacterized protein RHOBADRAFT_43705 [Rhodotorula graminis WP1]KPV75216.1 hypothetical protein RHOBADRAFT_43705 [Rhodotorula graminis WP1]
MSTPQPQPCVVRGAQTKNRCSACARAGVDLFFCSTAHQQLVWKVHRMVCGPDKAKPLMPPPLEEDELPAIFDALHLEIPYEDFQRDITSLTLTQASQAVRRGKITLARGMAVLWGEPADDFPLYMVTGLVGSRGITWLAAHPTVDGWLLGLRPYTYKYARIPTDVKAVYHFPARYVAAALEIALDLADDADSTTLLRHRSLLLAGILQKVPPPPSGVIISAVQQFVDSCLVYDSFEQAVAKFGGVLNVVKPVLAIELSLQLHGDGRISHCVVIPPTSAT